MLETDEFFNAEPTDPSVKGFVDSVLHPELEDEEEEEEENEESDPAELDPTIPAVITPATTAPAVTVPVATVPSVPAATAQRDAPPQAEDPTEQGASDGSLLAKTAGKTKDSGNRSKRSTKVHRQRSPFGFDFSSMVSGIHEIS